MLNSALAVMLPPSLRAPPMTTTGPRWPASLGSARMARARLVIGPMTARATARAGRSITSRTMASAAVPSAAGVSGLNGSRSPSPSAPWNSPAPAGSRRKGRSAPTKTGTSSRPAIWRSIRALRAVFSALTLPPTVVTASRSNAGEAKAVSNPVASSTPGSQSMMRDCFTVPVCRATTREATAARHSLGGEK
ncbi:hypothetical protein D3C86_1107980 [compost metagenome]